MRKLTLMLRFSCDRRIALKTACIQTLCLPCSSAKTSSLRLLEDTNHTQIRSITMPMALILEPMQSLTLTDGVIQIITMKDQPISRTRIMYLSSMPITSMGSQETSPISEPTHALRSVDRITVITRLKAEVLFRNHSTR